MRKQSAPANESKSCRSPTWGRTEIPQGDSPSVRIQREYPEFRIAGSGLTVEEMQLVHVDSSYVRGENGIDWRAYFAREDVAAEVRELLSSVPERVAEMHVTLGLPTAPEVRPSRHCFSPFPCEFWDRCTVGTARQPS